MKTVYLLRHGEYDRGTFRLTSRGVREIEHAIGLIIPEINPELIISIYHSPQARTAHAAEVAATKLIEYPVQIACAQELNDPDRFPNSAERKAAKDNMLTDMTALISKLSHQSILISHAPNLTAYLRDVEASPQGRELEYKTMSRAPPPTREYYFDLGQYAKITLPF